MFIAEILKTPELKEVQKSVYLQQSCLHCINKNKRETMSLEFRSFIVKTNNFDGYLC